MYKEIKLDSEQIIKFKSLLDDKGFVKPENIEEVKELLNWDKNVIAKMKCGD